MMYCCDVGSWNSAIVFYFLSEICIIATAFVKPNNIYFGIQLRLVSIHGDDIFFYKKLFTLDKQPCR